MVSVASTAGVASVASTVAAVVVAVAVVQVAAGAGARLGGGRQFCGDNIRVGHHGLHCGQRCTFGVR